MTEAGVLTNTCYYLRKSMSVADIEAELDRMTVREKLRIMEAVWVDLARREKDIPSPEWHSAELAARKARVKAGKERFVDWETTKKELRNRFK
jgi:putative addiction module component (TIGR02574 family)